MIKKELNNKIKQILNNINKYNNTLDLYYNINLLIDLFLINDSLYESNYNIYNNITILNYKLRSCNNKKDYLLYKKLIIDQIKQIQI